MKADVAIVLLNWNGWQDTLECLDSLLQLQDVRFAIVVVDNASTDSSREKILTWAAKHESPSIPLTSIRTVIESDLEKQISGQFEHLDFVYIQAESNGGFAAGNNLGIRLALNRQVNYVWLLNNDTVVFPNTLSMLVEKADTHLNIGICGSVLRFYHNQSVIQAVGGVYFDLWRARGVQIGQGLDARSKEVVSLGEIEPTYISGASMLVRREFIEYVGLMDEGYFLYFEEIDWAFQAKGRWIMSTATNSVVLHKEGGSIGTASLSRRSPMSQYYLNRNLIRFYWLRMPAKLPIAIARVCREAFACLIGNEGELFRMTCRALIDGLIGRFGRRNISWKI